VSVAAVELQGGAADSSAPSRRRLRTPNDSILKVVCLLPAIVWFTLLFGLPVVFLVWIGFWRVEDYQTVVDFSLQNYTEIAQNFVSRSRYGLSLLQSLWVAVTTGILATAFSYAVALAICFAVPLRHQRLVLLLAIAPFWSSYVLRVYAWQMILAKNGFFNSFLDAVGLSALRMEVIYTQIATRVGLVHYMAPILIVILFVSLSNVDRTLIEAARDLGCSRWQVFRRVILPLSAFGLSVALNFAIIIGLGDALCGALLGGGAGASILGKIPLLSTMIISDYASSTNLPRTAALAMVLVITMVLVLLVGFWASTRIQKATSE
jgi:spermidine/putrescine transport system permease protein